MANRRVENADCKLYVGDLPKDIQEREIERVFDYYGPVVSIWLARNPPGFAFVEFEDPRDARDAVKGLDGTKICGSRARVEYANGRSKSRRDDGRRGRQQSPARNGGRGGPSGRRPFDPQDRCFVCDERGHYSYDCPRKNGGSGGRSGARDSGGESRRRRSPSRSRSRSPLASKRRERSRSPTRSHRDRSPRRSVSRND